jgi:L-lactate dehydrogenase (cytochrome)
VLKALGLGARACLVGRAYLYGLGAGGEAGVREALRIIGEQLDAGMALTGLRDVTSNSRDVLLAPAASPGMPCPGQ